MKPAVRIKGRKLYIHGVYYIVDVEQFRSGDGELTGGGAYIEKEGRRIVTDVISQDDSSFVHEAGHAIADQLGIYLDEYKMDVWAELFAVCRDPRNFWFVEYLAGSQLLRKGEDNGTV